MQAFNAIALGMKRASSASSGRSGVENGDVAMAPRPQELRSSKRDRGQPEHYDPTQNGRQMQLTASQQRPPVCSPWAPLPSSFNQMAAHQQNVSSDWTLDGPSTILSTKAGRCHFLSDAHSGCEEARV